MNRSITSLVHELPLWPVDNSEKNESHFVVILLTDNSKATSIENKPDMKYIPSEGKRGSEAKSKSLKDWAWWS